MSDEVVLNVLLTFLCYLYVVVVILVSSKLPRLLGVSQKASRKFLHAMIGNLLFVVPFFTVSIYPTLVAAPFILVTFLASPYTPYPSMSKRMKGLADLSEKGHGLGLVFYAISYTSLALFFTSRPIVIAAGILPMAYGDSLASLFGERYSRGRYKVVGEKSLVGSAVMFLSSFLSFVISLIFFSTQNSFSVVGKLPAALATAAVATLIEGLSPMGFDNLTVPALGATTFLLLSGAS